MSSEVQSSHTKILPSQLRPTAHTTYYSSFFLLRTPVTINGQPAQVWCSDDGELTLNSRYPSLSLPLHSIRVSLEEVLKTRGVSQVGDAYCEEVPLFPVTFCSEYNLRKFLISRETAQQQLESLFPVKLLTHDKQASSDQSNSDLQPTSSQQPASDQLPTHVQLQLFLVSPDAVTKDAQVIEVTLENHSACMALFKESEMFDYWSIFRAYRAKINNIFCEAQLTIKDLVSELHDVVRWFQLGIYLDISPPELMKIRADHRETEPCKTEMLVTWLRQTREASWSQVVKALVGMRMGTLAQKVALKYGVAVPSAVERKELQQFPVVKEKVSSLQSQLFDRAQLLNQELEGNEQRLSKINHALEQATKLRVSARNKRLHTRQEADSAYVRVKVLLERRKEVERQLQFRQRELRFLQQLQGQQKDREEEEREREELKAVLMCKDAEVRQLQHQLRDMERELGCAREETHSLREELHRLTAELAEKSADIQQLERERDRLEIYLDRENKKVEMLLIQSAVSSKEALQKEIKDQLTSMEEESNEIVRSEVEAFKQTIAEKEWEIAKLSEELQTLQSQLHKVKKCQPEEDEEGNLHRLMVETSELRVKLLEAEHEKQEGERRLEAIHQQMESFQQLIAELRENKNDVPQPDPQIVGHGLELAETGQQAHFEVDLVDMAGDPCTTEQQVTAELRSLVDSSHIWSIHYLTWQKCNVVGQGLELAELRKKKCAASWPDSQKCTVVGQGLEQAETGQKAHFEVHLVDMAGNPCTTEQQVTAELRSLVDSSVTPASVVHKTPDIYEVSYQPNTRGRHKLSVVVNDEPVQGSPFLVYVRQAPHLLGRPVRIFEEFNDPYMVATTRSEEFIVSEHGKISVIGRDGKTIQSIDTTSVRSGIRKYKLDPWGVAVDEDSNIYVSDVESHRLAKFNSDGKLVKSVGGKGDRIGQFSYPRGIAISMSSKLFVCDSGNHRIQVFDTNLKFTFEFGKKGSDEGEMGCPNDLSFDPAGNLYVADSRHDCIQVFSQNGTYLRAFGVHGSRPGELSSPMGVHVDHDYVYVAEWGNHRVSVFQTSGAFITSFGKGGSGEGEMVDPAGITTDQDGFLYVCDSNNYIHRIQMF